MRRTRFLVSASTAAAIARKVLPVPAGPMPTTMSLSAIFWRYSAWPLVFAWMSLRTPGSAILPSPLPLPPFCPRSPSAPSSSLRRSTSSGVSSMRCRARSTMRRAVSVARSTSSPGPEMVIASPRSATFTPNRRESSTRLPSFTPARVSMSAPSVDTFWVVDPSLTRPLP